jgi:hypothetical protein
VSSALIEDMGFDALREFWPEISRKLKLPSHGERETDSVDAVSLQKQCWRCNKRGEKVRDTTFLEWT